MLYDHHVIVIPGLGNEIEKHIWATNGWRRHGITPHVFNPKWKIEEPSLTPKLTRAMKLVDDLVFRGKTVSLVGNSAGSSFVLNVFHKRKSKIHKVVINCGRVRTGDWPWYTFDQASASSPSFRTSVLKAETIIEKLTREDKKKILTLRPIFDEIVPPSTVPIKSATNEIIPSVEHVVSIALTMTVLNEKILGFLLR